MIGLKEARKIHKTLMLGTPHPLATLKLAFAKLYLSKHIEDRTMAEGIWNVAKTIDVIRYRSVDIPDYRRIPPQ